MAKSSLKLPPFGWLVGGAIVLGGGFILWQNPSILQNIQTQIQNVIHPTSPSATSTPTTTTTVPNITSTPTSSVVTPPLSQIEGGTITPFYQNVFCDPTLGLNWDPLQGKCVQSLQSSSGNCAAGSHFDHYQCQCVPNGIPQPQGYRDCTTACTDKVNQVFSWCQLGCVPKSAVYANPRLAACPPM